MVEMKAVLTVFFNLSRLFLLQRNFTGQLYHKLHIMTIEYAPDISLFIRDMLHYIAHITFQYLAKCINGMGTDTFISF